MVTAQIIVQLDASPIGEPRVIIQSAENVDDITTYTSKDIKYSELTAGEKTKWTNFVNMINAK